MTYRRLRSSTAVAGLCAAACVAMPAGAAVAAPADPASNSAAELTIVDRADHEDRAGHEEHAGHDELDSHDDHGRDGLDSAVRDAGTTGWSDWHRPPAP